MKSNDDAVAEVVLDVLAYALALLTAGCVLGWVGRVIWTAL